MITVKKDTTLIGVSELRNKVDQLLKKSRSSHIVIEKRHKPVAVIMSSTEYAKNEELIEFAEDVILGYAAKMRYEKSSDKDFINIEELLKKI